MSLQDQIKIFESKKVRTVWDDQTEEWYFSIVDVCAVLNDMEYQTARKYWKVLKGRLIKEGFEPVTNCYQLKLMAHDGKKRLTDVATPEQLFRIIQSIPSKKAEPFKQWMAEVAAGRHPHGFKESADIAKQGGKIAGDARRKLEEQIGHSVITSDKATYYLPPIESQEALPED